jgi:hypothetical protein
MDSCLLKTTLHITSFLELAQEKSNLFQTFEFFFNEIYFKIHILIPLKKSAPGGNKFYIFVINNWSICR